MPAATCPRCDGALPERLRFCTTCGLRLDGAAAPTASAASPPPPLRPCPLCGASNAASRRRCGRCDGDLRAPAAVDAEPDIAPHLAAAEVPLEDEGPLLHGQAGSPVVFAVVVSLAGLAILGVIGSVLHAGGGFGSSSAAAGDAAAPVEVALPVASVRASSVADSGDVAFEPGNLLDRDPRTVWRDGTDGSGVGEWVELRLDGTPEVSRLLLWNGDQRPGAFAGSTRAVRIRIDLDDRTFTADLLDVDGPQAVDLPETIAASSVRVTMLEILDGAGNLAISDIELRGPPPSAADAEEPPGATG